MSKRMKKARIYGITGRLRVELLEGRWVPSTAAMFQSMVAHGPAIVAPPIELETPEFSRPTARPQIENAIDSVGGEIVGVRPEQTFSAFPATTDSVDSFVTFNVRPRPNTPDGSVLVLPTPPSAADGNITSGEGLDSTTLDRSPDRLGGGKGNHVVKDSTEGSANQNGSGHSFSANLASEFRPRPSAKDTVGHSGTSIRPVEAEAIHVASADAVVPNTNSGQLESDTATSTDSSSSREQSPIHAGWFTTAAVTASSNPWAGGDYRAEAQSASTDGIFAGRRTGIATGRTAASLGFNAEAPTVADDGTLNYHTTALVLNSPDPLVTETEASVSAFAPHTAGLHTALSAFEIPMLHLSAWGEQVAELMNSLTTSETAVIVSSCVVVLLAAGVGSETLRRHRRRMALQLVSNAPGAVVLDLSLLV